MVHSSRLCRIMFSKSPIQNSTGLGAVGTGLLNVTFSFSMLFIPTISTVG